jgi:hypothetical protein
MPKTRLSVKRINELARMKGGFITRIRDMKGDKKYVLWREGQKSQDHVLLRQVTLQEIYAYVIALPGRLPETTPRTPPVEWWKQPPLDGR